MTQTRYLKADQTGDIELAAQMLKEGKLVAFPTETVYGLGAHALDSEAIRRVYEAKKRPQSNPLIVHVASSYQALKLFDFESSAHAKLFRERFEILSANFWPGPLTLVGKKASHISNAVTANSHKVAVRIPSHKTAQALLKQCGLPICAPSANLYTRPSPTTHEHVALNLDSQIDAVIDAGRTDFGIESTVVDIDALRPRILRHGVISSTDLLPFLPDLEVSGVGVVHEVTSSPGMSEKHYAPALGQVRLASESEIAKAWFGSAGLILRNESEKSFSQSLGERPASAGPTVLLSDHPSEIASELFGAFYEMEKYAPDTLLIEDLLPLAKEPAWASICDKLLRATK